MILVLILTLIACTCYIIFEKIKVACYQNKITRSNPFFTVGSLALVGCWIYMGFRYWNDGNLWIIPYGVRVILGIVAVIVAMGLYVYILVFALPKGTYDDDQVQSTLATEGIYGMCRHPGFYGFTMVALAITLLIGDVAAFAILLAHSALNLLYIYLQDKYYFPVYLEGYEEYKRQVPFLAFWRK